MMRIILLFILSFPIILLAKSDVYLIMYADALMHVSQNTIVDTRDNEIYRVLQVEYVFPDSATGNAMIDTLLVFAENLRHTVPGSISIRLDSTTVERYYTRGAARKACPDGWNIASTYNLGTFSRWIESNDTLYVGTSLMYRVKRSNNNSSLPDGAKLGMYEKMKDVPTGWYNYDDKRLYGVDSLSVLWTSSLDENGDESENLVPSLILFDGMVPSRYPSGNEMYSVRCAKSSNNNTQVSKIPLFSQDISDYSFKKVPQSFDPNH